MTRIFLFAWALLLCWPAFANAGVRIVVPTRDIARGTTISQADLTTKTVDGKTFEPYEEVVVECAAAYWDDAQGRDDLQILSEPRELPFDAAGNLPEEMTNVQMTND